MEPRARRTIRHHWVAERPAHRGRAADAARSGGYADLGRQATNPQWQYPTVWNPKANYTWTRGKQSLKAGYEFQRVNVEVQDVNPLYGRDTYSGQYSRPDGIGANNIYNLGDFMLGLRSQYALSNVLVAEMQRNMHFTYLQDDVRVNDHLTANLGLRYEYATPMWEANNQLSNYDPTGRRMIIAKDGSLTDRTLMNPDRNNFAPRLGFAYTPMLEARHSRRLRHQLRARQPHGRRGPSFDQRSTGHQRRRQSGEAGAERSDLPSDGTGISGRPHGSVEVQPAHGEHQLHPGDYQAGRVQSYFASVQREFGPRMLVDVAYVGNKGDELLLIANYNQATPNNAAGTIPLQARRPIPEFSDITYVFNGGKSKYDALQMKYEWRAIGGVTLLTSLTLSKTKDNGAQSLENNNGNFPAPQDYLQPRRGVRHRPATTSPTTARRASSCRCRSDATSGGARMCRRRSTS